MDTTAEMPLFHETNGDLGKESPVSVVAVNADDMAKPRRLAWNRNYVTSAAGVLSTIAWVLSVGALAGYQVFSASLFKFIEDPFIKAFTPNNSDVGKNDIIFYQVTVMSTVGSLGIFTGLTMISAYRLISISSRAMNLLMLGHTLLWCILNCTAAALMVNTGKHLRGEILAIPDFVVKALTVELPDFPPLFASMGITFMVSLLLLFTAFAILFGMPPKIRQPFV